MFDLLPFLISIRRFAIRLYPSFTSACYTLINNGKMEGKPTLTTSMLCSLAIAAAGCVQTGKEEQPPHIIFILADDLGWTDLGCYGSTFYETPNIDRLAGEGMRFTDAYAACPVSSPTRACYQTGKYPARLGMTDYLMGRYHHPERKKEMDKVCPVLPPALVPNLPLTEKTVGAAFRENGYTTIHVGKWHCAQDSLYFPHRHGYDINVAGCSKGSPGKAGYFSPYDNPYLPDGAEGEYLTDRLTDEAIRLIEENKGKPFFLNLHYYQVHLPLQAKEDKIKYFEKKARLLGLDKTSVYNRDVPWKRKVPFKVNLAQRRVQSNPVYAAMLSSLDDNIGRLIGALEENGLYDRTVILFYSDNGGLSIGANAPTSTLPLNGGKGYLYEGGVRVPLIVKWKGNVTPGSVTCRYVSTPDFYPTLLQMAGIPPMPAQHTDGVSFVPVLRGDNQYERGAIFWHYPHYHNQGGRPSGAVRSGDYKLIRYYDTEELELFDLKNDIGEQVNLAEQEPEKTKELNELLKKWLEDTHSRMPLENPDI